MNKVILDVKYLSQQTNFFKKKFRSNAILYNRKRIIRTLIHYLIFLLKALFTKNKNVGDKIILSIVKKIDKDVNSINTNEYVYPKISINVYSFIKELVLFPMFFYCYFFIRLCKKDILFYNYLKARIILKYLKSNNISDVLFYVDTYNLCYTITALFLKLEKININIISFLISGFPASELIFFPCDKMIVSTNIQKNYVHNQTGADNIKAEKKIQYIKDIKLLDFHRKNIAIYSTGMYARVEKKKFVKKETFNKLLIAEEKMINIMHKFAIKNRDLSFCIFIHLLGNIENIEDASVYYRDLLKLPNVSLQHEKHNSISQFHNYNLGVTSFSTVFFDRLQRGYKSLLIETPTDYAYYPSLKKVSCFDTPKANNVILKFNNMTEFDFFNYLLK